MTIQVSPGQQSGFNSRPMPADFHPEMTTVIDQVTGNELRTARFGTVAMGYVLSMPEHPEWREEQPARDAALRLTVWQAAEAVRLYNEDPEARLYLESVGYRPIKRDDGETT